MLIWEGNFALLICLYPKPSRRRACRRRSSLGRYPDLVRVPFRGIVCCSCTRMSAATWRCGLVCSAAAGSTVSRARCPRDRNCAVPGGAPARRRIRVILAMWGMRCCGIRPLASRKHPPMRYELSIYSSSPSWMQTNPRRAAALSVVSMPVVCLVKNSFWICLSLNTFSW